MLLNGEKHLHISRREKPKTLNHPTVFLRCRQFCFLESSKYSESTQNYAQFLLGSFPYFISRPLPEKNGLLIEKEREKKVSENETKIIQSNENCFKSNATF